MDESSTHEGPPEAPTLERLKENDWIVLVDQIKAKKCTPILGTETRSEDIEIRSTIATEWAEEYKFPLRSTVNLARVSRYVAVNFDADFAKRKLCTRLAGVPPPNFDDADNPYSILASLSIPVFVTTNYDDYMAEALVRADKDVIREKCRWNKLLTDPPSVFGDGYNPTPAAPVVFHFHGQIDDLDSLVLTEDDYFEFLINVSRDPKLIPSRIEKALTSTSLLLLGYRLDDWDFRVMFHLLASYLEISTTRTHVAVQLAPLGDEEPEDLRRRAQDYLRAYFSSYRRLNIRLYPGTCREFMADLKKRL